MAIRSLECPVPLAARGFFLAEETAEHLPFLRQLYAWQRWGDLAMLPWDNQQKATFLDSQFDMQRRAYAAQYPDPTFLAVCEGATVAGRLYLAEDKADIRLVDILLHPERRGQGIGGALISGLQTHAAALGLAVTLHVDKTNPAQMLYQRLGFQVAADAGVVWRMEWR